MQVNEVLPQFQGRQHLYYDSDTMSTLRNCPDTCHCRIEIAACSRNLIVERCTSDPGNALATLFDSYINVATIDIVDSPLSDLPNNIIQMPNLVGLQLITNGLKHIPDVVLKLSKLFFLSVPGNKIQRLSQVSALSELILIDLERMDLEYGFEEITKLPNLIIVLANNNNIPQLPSSIKDLTNLTILDLHCNKIQILPTEIEKLSKLIYLDVSFNQLTILRIEAGN